MRQTTIRTGLEEAFAACDIAVDVSDIRVHKGKRANGGAVKLVDATVTTKVHGLTLRVTDLATQALRDEPKARQRLAKWAERQVNGPSNWQQPKAATIRDIAKGGEAASGPVCGRQTKSGDTCGRPSADGSACWQHGGDSARKGLVAKSGGNVVTHKQARTVPAPSKAPQVDWEAVAAVAAAAAAKAAVEAAIAAHASA